MPVEYLQYLHPSEHCVQTIIVKKQRKDEIIYGRKQLNNLTESTAKEGVVFFAG